MSRRKPSNNDMVCNCFYLLQNINNRVLWRQVHGSCHILTSLKIHIDQKNFILCKGQGRSHINRNKRFANATFVTKNSYYFCTHYYSAATIFLLLQTLNRRVIYFLKL